MSRAISVNASKPFGLQRVCQVLGFPRSTIYAVRARTADNVVPIIPGRRGPKPKMPDADLLKAIRDDLAASPFIGEGHRKVWARLRILSGIRVSRTRVLRLMREHRLLSPHRRAPGEPNLHDGRITTDCPNEMWGTDGVRIATVDDGMVWIFSAVDHCDGMCTGIHAAKIGDRFAALEPIAQGLLGEFGCVAADVGRGLSLRMDHGSQYTSDDFREQIKFWGIAASYAFVAEPQTNGVAERFNRTLKEQAIHGRIFSNLEEVRTAVVAFKDRYNRDWRLEKLGFMSPLEARQARLMKLAA
ncbi:integrase core domain-containing protein [Caballeronia sordidicola]|jgi:putative transposase|uniref:Mobile element protein n=1 Tax=Caballeronia sordidicola TaxID=196367 RepID=A0A226WX40_CABSO|nr:integrase core domain-containing protein [Caballeronia sordidicola]OXC75751.1 Mobile element protein [Caballeronia sordidicola]